MQRIMTQRIAIVSGKGGVGKTTAAINLGTALTNYGKHVVVLDFDVTTPNVGLHLGISKVPVSLHDVLKGKNAMSDAAYKHVSGLKIIPGSIHSEDQNISQAYLQQLPDQILELEGKTEMILIDAPSGIGAETKIAMRAADELLLIVTPDLISVTDALKTLSFGREQGIRIKGVLINRSRGESFELTNENISVLLNAPILGIIPEDSHIRKSVQLKSPVVYSYPESTSAQSYMRIAQKILGKSEAINMQKEEKETKAHKYWKRFFG